VWRSLPKRTLSLRLPQLVVIDEERFFNLLAKAAKTRVSNITIRKGKILVELEGDKASIRETIIAIRRLLREYRIEEAGGWRVYNARFIHRLAGIAVPLDVVAEVLKLEGWPSEDVGEGLKTKASIEVVADASRRVSEAIKTLESIYAARTAKKLLAAAGAYTLADMDEIIDEALSLGLLEEDSEGKLAVKGPWKNALRKLVKSLR